MKEGRKEGRNEGMEYHILARYPSIFFSHPVVLMSLIGLFSCNSSNTTGLTKNIWTGTMLVRDSANEIRRGKEEGNWSSLRVLVSSASSK